MSNKYPLSEDRPLSAEQELCCDVKLRIGLAPQHFLSEEDLYRAHLCAEAAYMESDTEAEKLFRDAMQAKTNYATFKKVSISRNLVLAGLKGNTRGQQYQDFLVAHGTDNTIFVAFKGTGNLEDVACDMSLEWQKHLGGKVHTGFLKRALSLKAYPIHNPLASLLGGNARLILCGHSLGGAVAHVALLDLLLAGGPAFQDHRGLQVG